ncbi:enoyl-CoA hydratase/isomerase family protein [Caenimonas sedimenti]|uniref:enoyl-CoA hydratase/isomerase family protein n=1 Tax=Caenimonas sedimenti TaxID=2596921 RepID=UPI0032C3D6CC
MRAIVLGSAVPGRFCAGLDLPRLKDSSPAEVHASVGRLYAQLFELQSGLPEPTIAAISGAVRGGGMSIAITCDMLVAADDASFGYPEMEVGLLPAIHYTHLPRIVGRYRAFDLLLPAATSMPARPWLWGSSAAPRP